MHHAFEDRAPSPVEAPSLASRLSPVARLVGYVVLLPLLLLALGVWQLDRAGRSAAELDRVQAELPPVLERLEALAKRDPNAVVRFEGVPTALSAKLAVSRVQERVDQLATDRLVAQGRHASAWTTLVGAGLALAAGLIGLVLSTVAGAMARLSREQLVRAFSLVRHALPPLLSAQMGGLAAACLGASLFEAGGLWFAQRVSVGEIKLVLGGGLVLAAMLYAVYLAIVGLRRCFALFAPQPIDVFGRAVDDAEAPGLWRFTRELARRQGAVAPDRIVVGLTDGFFVTAAPVRLWPEDRALPQGRTLYVPATYLALLNGREVAAIVGHELAHFTGEDTAYSQRFAPIYASLENAFGALAENGGAIVLWPSLALGAQIIGGFDRAVAHWRRLREFEADRHGSTVSGPEAAASALLRTSTVSPAITAVLDDAADRPGRTGDDLVALLETPARALPDPTAHLDDRQPHPTDTHPPVRQRIAALGVTVDERLLAAAARPVGAEEHALARGLFADWPGLCRRLTTDFVGQAHQQQAELQAVLEDAAAAAPAERTTLYENVKIAAWTFGVIAVLASAAAAALLAFARPLGLGSDPVLLAGLVGFLLVAALGSAAYVAVVLRRGRKPFLVLDAQALHSPLLHEPIAWRDIAGYQVVQDQRFSLILAIEPDSPLPSKAGRSMRAGISRRKRLVTLYSLGVRGLKPEAYAELIGRYLQAARARAMLASRAAA
ncbi:MAG TPA: M48 family metallopeptidase [Beijerinckiaceae bacterium]|jgi:Zn-dependent protease with chaperone function